MAAPQSEAFQTAVVDSKKLTSKPSNDELLELYGTSLQHCSVTTRQLKHNCHHMRIRTASC
jgi:acyl-CoA-binding protein